MKERERGERETGPQHFSQAIPKGTRKGPELYIHTCVTMADLQMKLLRKKIQKRNENRKKRKLLSKPEEQDDSGMDLEMLKLLLTQLGSEYCEC